MLRGCTPPPHLFRFALCPPVPPLTVNSVHEAFTGLPRSRETSVHPRDLGGHFNVDIYLQNSQWMPGHFSCRWMSHWPIAKMASKTKCLIKYLQNINKPKNSESKAIIYTHPQGYTCRFPRLHSNLPNQTPKRDPTESLNSIMPPSTTVYCAHLGSWPCS